MKLPSFSFLLQALLAVFNRFPATMLAAVVGVGAAMTAIEGHNDDNMVKLWMMAQIGLALCTALVVFAESRQWKQPFVWGIQLFGLGLLALYYFLFDMHALALEQIHVPRYAGILVVAHLLAAFGPYLNRLPVADFWEYNKQLFANFVVGGVYTLILFSGLSLAILAVNELFDLSIDEKIYAHLFVLLAGLFNTAFFLSHLPRNFAFDDREAAYNVIFKNLCQYILIPIVGLYFLILYAYSIKILVTWSLPKGWVSSLVLGFSVAGMFTYLINFRLTEISDSKTVHAFRRWFWWVLLPMVALLFVAIGRRIADYGVTEERYFVAHAGLWLLAMCVYFLWSRSDNIKFIPISLAAFTLVALLGPLSAFSVAQRSQASILRRLLAENGRFDGDKLKQSQAPMPKDATDRISSCLNFLESREVLWRIADWFPAPLDSIAPESSQKYMNRKAIAISRWLGIEHSKITDTPSPMFVVYPKKNNQWAGDISGYRRFYRLDLSSPGRRKDAAFKVYLSDNRKALILAADDGKQATDSLDLTPGMRDWTRRAENEFIYLLPDSAVGIDLTGTRTMARLYIQEARFDPAELTIANLKGWLFLK